MSLCCFVVGVQFWACQRRDVRTEATNAASRAATRSALFVRMGVQT